MSNLLTYGFRVEPVLADFLTWNRLRGSMYRLRMKHYPIIPDNFTDLSRILLSDQHQHISLSFDLRNHLFKSVVGPPGHQILIFLSKGMRKFMRFAKIVFSDGTLGSRPAKPTSQQIFLISTVIRDTVSH